MYPKPYSIYFRVTIMECPKRFSYFFAKDRVIRSTRYLIEKPKTARNPFPQRVQGPPKIGFVGPKNHKSYGPLGFFLKSQGRPRGLGFRVQGALGQKCGALKTKQDLNQGHKRILPGI